LAKSAQVNDLDELLGAAEFMGRKLGAPNGELYARWLEGVFKDVKPVKNEMDKAVRALHASEIPICTLNYDPLLERTTGLRGIHIGETSKVTAWMRGEDRGILHLHGSWDAPATCILGIRDYETALSNDVRDLIQRSLTSFNRLLFIGCGDTFQDPNFSALIKWLRERMKSVVPQHHALVADGEVAARHADSMWHGFVEPIGYGANHDDLPALLLRHFPLSTTKTRKKKVSAAKDAITTTMHAKVLDDYRAFLLKDCGQMTIEGVRADLDTAQRRFDLERLFVPLHTLPIPPEIPASDPERERKLLEWQEKNSEPFLFGDVFTKHKRLALLALPGGGKSLLLKRLAVAYADPTRRQNSKDNLPDNNLMPVLIRCREWREYIRRPIPALLQNLAALTGQVSLAALYEALIPLLKQGRVLLLVDGLDEIHNDADRSTFVEHLETFLEDHKLIRLVVTSREAGFSLVAPCLMRFCVRWRIAPLDDGAITTLCAHWHRLMKGEGPEAQEEGQEVAQQLLRSAPLRLLAENPLLLTMLLVVKHGAGRLPPDRASLYDRAVEVLLDTWNIKGHAPLNAKEAVPQLAYIAFQLMRSGKQTATEKQLLILLEEARETVPQIRRHAKDTPYEFLKRVELRSGLMIEAGHQLEGGRTVPFYQFRHLTFQEYLSAVAVVEGHYMDYHKGDTVLTPLRPYLTAEEWKEVIPMAAVLARKQAEPLIAALATEANSLRMTLEAGEIFSEKEEWLRGGKLPSSVSRLVQCLAEEAEASSETLMTALQVIGLFARGCGSRDNWQVISCGLYGDELLHQTWLLYEPLRWEREWRIRNTLASVAAYRFQARSSSSQESTKELIRLLRSQEVEEIVRGLLICAGLFWNEVTRNSQSPIPLLPVSEVVPHMFQEKPSITLAAVWAWGAINRLQRVTDPDPSVWDRLFALWRSNPWGQIGNSTAAFALEQGLRARPREIWTPILTEEQKDFVRRCAEGSEETSAASLVVAFHAKDVFSDEELAHRLAARRTEIYTPEVAETAEAMLRQMGEIGRKHLRSTGSRRAKQK
jgi:SIR2-like domain